MVLSQCVQGSEPSYCPQGLNGLAPDGHKDQANGNSLLKSLPVSVRYAGGVGMLRVCPGYAPHSLYTERLWRHNLEREVVLVASFVWPSFLLRGDFSVFLVCVCVCVCRFQR